MRRTIYSLLFVLTLIQNAVGQMNCASNTCHDAEQLNANTPDACEESEIINVKHSCLGAATPNPEIEHCGVDSLPTVWFQIQISSTDANQLVTLVEADGFNPVWSIYEGSTCADLNILNEQYYAHDNTGSLFCSISDSILHDNHATVIGNDEMTGLPKSYWIAVSGYPLAGEDIITNDDFTLFYSASLGCLACSGDNVFDCDNGEFTATVDGAFYDPDGDGVAGPFCPGQEVEVCFSFNFDTTGSGNDWLHGLIPTLGSGWDMQSINFATQNLGDSSWVWYEMGEECYPRLNGASMPNLCTYEEDGVLKLCNTACNPSCPCIGEQPLEDGSVLPSGWFWNSPACGDGNCPHEEYGIPNGVNVDISSCMTLKVKTFNSIEDFQSQNDLQVYIQPTSDAVTGCWTDQNPCILDPSVNSPNWRVAYFDIPQVELTETTICNGESVSFELNNNLNDDYDILIVPIPNEDVDGAMTQDLDAVQSFSIQDSLINNSDEIQMQSYEVSGFGTGANCNSFSDTLMVFVYPDINFNFADLVLCPGDTYSVNALENTEGGTGNYVSTVWSPTLSTDPILLISDQSINQYCVTVTDDFGCTGSTCFDVQFEMQPSLELIDTAEVCNMAIGDAMTSINLNDYLVQASNGSWSSLDGIPIDNDTVDFIGAELGSYAFEFSTSSAVEPCINVADTLVVEVVSCECPPFQLVESQTLCLSEVNSFDLNDLIIQAEEGTWSLVDGSELILNGSVLDLSTASAGMYDFVYNLNMPIQGCPSSQAITLDLIDIEAQLFLTSVQCFGESNGEFRVVAFPFNGLFSYLWEDGSEDDRITDLSGGEYMVTVTHDESQCQEVFSAYIPEPAELVVVIEPNGDSLQAIVTGGVETYTYIWSTGAFTSSILPDEAGDYSVTIIDDNSCMSTAYFNYVSTADQLIDIDVYPNPFRDEIVVEGDMGEVDEVKLIDPLGRLVQSTVNLVSGRVQISVSNINAGIYYLEIIRNGKSYYKKMVCVE